MEALAQREEERDPADGDEEEGREDAEGADGAGVVPGMVGDAGGILRRATW